MVRLYQDQALWDTVRDNALQRMAREHAPQDYRTRVAEIMAEVFAPPG
ncbi:hypothetical protein RAA17_13710 [Komagataeibacter rhaeticus]|nr:hypothetical protein [Komagataeibacter rhaeticus]